jgi:WD40 repeat protein
MHQGRIYTLLTDVDRLLLLYREPIIHSALHVYHSALATMPSCLLLEETAPHDGYGIPLLITKRAPSWGLRETIIDQSDSVYRLTYSPNGKLIAAVAASEVGVWDLATGTALYTWSGNDTQLSVRCAGSVAFSPNGQWIAFTQGSILQVWDVVTGSQQCIMEGYSDTDTALCIAFSPDSTTIVSGSCDHTVRVWDASTGAEQLVMTGHTDCVNALAFAPDGQNIVSASDDGTLRLWDVLSGTELRVIDADSGKLYCVAFSPDGATIASGAENGTIQLWSATSDSRQHALEGHRHGVRSFAFSPDGKSIVSCPTIGSPWIWDATTGIQKRSLRNGVFCVAYSPDGKSVALGLEDGTTRIWDAKTDATTHCATDGHWDPVFCMSFSPDSMLIASGSRDGTVRVWNAITGAERHVIEVGSTVVSVAFSPDSRTIVCCQWKGTVQWWDVASGLEQSSRTGQPHASSVRSVAFSPDSKFMVSYSSSPIGGTAQVWDVVTGAVQHTLTHPVPDTGLSWDRRASFSTDGKAIILRDCSRAIVFGSWDLTTTTHPQYAKSTSPHEPARAIDDLHASEQQDIGLPAPRYLFDKHGSPWIQLDNGQEEPKDICWLPPECRGLMEYSGTKVCVGGRDGAITILDFSPVGLLQ